MNWWATPVTAAAVSALVTLWFRWRDRTEVLWVPVGEAHDAYEDGRKSGKIRFTVVAHNAGTGTAYDVRTRRRRGPQ